MAVRITHIGGTTGFFREGDEIVGIDSHPITDQLDLLFNLPEEGSATFTVRRGEGGLISRRLRIGTYERAGLVFEEMRFTRCRSRCLFCFVEQMPPGLRLSLYEKDDDYRLSFLYGNFITLNDVTGEDIRRIIDMRLSPLYISVHAVDASTRERLFGRPMNHDILELIAELAANGITMHAQIVLVPGFNDGEVLAETVEALFEFYPACRSLAIVPVGLTAHREGLTPLEVVSEEAGAGLVSWAEERRRRFREETGGVSFLHLSDEFYLMRGGELPQDGEYDDYPQIANGVGMCRLFVGEIENQIERLAGRGGRELAIALVTGTLGELFLRRHVLPLVDREIPWLRVALIRVDNRLFGDTVGVSGLIAGADIIEAAAGVSASCIVLPPNAINHEGLLIDGTSPGELESALGLPVLVPRSTFLERAVLSACERGGA